MHRGGYTILKLVGISVIQTMIMSPELSDDEAAQEPGISLFVVYFSLLFKSSKL